MNFILANSPGKSSCYEHGVCTLGYMPTFRCIGECPELFISIMTTQASLKRTETLYETIC